MNWQNVLLTLTSLLSNLNFPKVSASSKVHNAITQKLTYLPETEKKVAQTGTVLAYVTPWNGFGYDQAKKYANKLDYVSPCWFQIDDQNKVNGEHDVDKNFIKDLKSNKFTKVVPRILVNMFSIHGNGKQVLDRKNIEGLSKALLSLKGKYNFGGYVIECGWLAYLNLQKDMTAIEKNMIPNLIKLSKLVKRGSKSLKLILVVPPISRTSFRYFTDAHFDLLEPHFDFFSLMTYDYPYTKNMPIYPDDETVHPNAPLPWIETAVLDIVGGKSENLQNKILLGLNFYGRYWPTRVENALTKNSLFDYVDKILKEKKKPNQKENQSIKLKWFKDFAEQVIHLPETEENFKTSVSFPSVRSINKRLQLANRINSGISIWEIGQGFDEFLAVFPEGKGNVRGEEGKDEL